MKRIGISLCVFIVAIGISFSAHGALVDMHDGTVYDTDTELSWLKDAGEGSFKSWADANTWAASLSVGGLTGWRLPAADPACGSNYSCINSEMGHLYYTVLGNAAGGPLANAGPFMNLSPAYYWSGTEYKPETIFAWVFYFGNGSQFAFNKPRALCVWAVRPGVRAAERPALFDTPWFSW